MNSKNNIFIIFGIFFGWFFTSCDHEKDIPVKDILFSKMVLTLEVGQKDRIEATIVPENATVQTLLWRSENEGIARVADGEVTGAGKGTTIVTASTPNGSVTKQLTVIVLLPTDVGDIPVSNILLSKNVSILEAGQKDRIEATIVPANATVQTLIWHSDNESVATVDDGEITGVGEGMATVTVSTPSGSVTKQLTVIVPPRIDMDEFPVLAWDEGYPGTITVERCRIMREAGVNLNFVRKMTHITQAEIALDAARAAGIRMLIQCPELESDTRNTVERFMNHPALFGWNIADEPNIGRAPELVALGNRIKTIDNKHPVYINYYPFVDPDPTYIQMVNNFAPPLSFLSFDHYCLVVDSPDPNAPRRLYPYYYQNLEIISSEAKKLGKPFWSFALTAAHWSYPKPTLSDLHFQLYSILAYGAQGIQFFNWENVNYDDFTCAPIDHLTQQTTDVYELVKQITQEIRDLTYVFLGAKMITVRHTGTNLPRGVTRLTTLPAPVISFNTTGQGAVVSHLENGAHEYLLIVNRDVNNTVTMTVNVASAVKRILKSGEAILPGTGVQTLQVAAGDALLYTWEK